MIKFKTELFIIIHILRLVYTCLVWSGLSGHEIQNPIG